MPLSFTRYYILEKPNQWLKLFCETGFLTSHFEEIQLYRIEDLSLNQSLSNKIWKVGNITVKSNDKSMPVFNITRVKNPYKVYDKLTELIARDRRDRNFRWGEYQG